MSKVLKIDAVFLTAVKGKELMESDTEQGRMNLLREWVKNLADSCMDEEALYLAYRLLAGA